MTAPLHVNPRPEPRPRTRFERAPGVAAVAAILLAALPAPVRAEPSFTPLGFLPGGDRTLATAISGDGRVVVGEADDAGGDTLAFRWEDGVLSSLGDLPGGTVWSTAAATSYLGDVVVGSSDGSELRSSEAFHWQAGTLTSMGVGPVYLCAPPVCGYFEPESQATELSADGAYAVVEVNVAGAQIGTRHEIGTADYVEVFRSLSSNYRMKGMSDDATVFTLVETVSGNKEAWRVEAETSETPWQDGVATAIPLTPTHVSGNGETLVGYSGSESSELGYRWSNGLTSGLHGGLPAAVSYDGSVVVGSSAGGASVWDAENGWCDLKIALIAEYGLVSELSGWQLQRAVDISDDRLRIAGYGMNPSGDTESFVVTVDPDFFPTPAACAAEEIPSLPPTALGALGLALLATATARLRQRVRTPGEGG